MSKVVERGEGGCVVLGVWVVWEGMVSLLSKDGRMMFSRTRCVIVYEYYVFFLSLYVRNSILHIHICDGTTL